jgi:hypothetical protein
VRETRRSADKAADQVFRGVVAASSAIEVVDELEDVEAADERTDDDPQG